MTDRWPADPTHISKTVERLRMGAVVSFPTDTLYAIAARAADPIAIERLYAAKRRPVSQPLIWLVKDRSQVEGAAVVSAAAAKLMERYWPGPLTLVLPRHQSGATLAVRAPNHPVALQLLDELGEPMGSSSANRAAERPPVNADDVIAGLAGDIDIVLDGGPSQIGEPSTILDLAVDPPRILRQGAIPAEDLLA